MAPLLTTRKHQLLSFGYEVVTCRRRSFGRANHHYRYLVLTDVPEDDHGQATHHTCRGKEQNHAGWIIHGDSPLFTVYPSGRTASSGVTLRIAVPTPLRPHGLTGRLLFRQHPDTSLSKLDKFKILKTRRP